MDTITTNEELVLLDFEGRISGDDKGTGLGRLVNFMGHNPRGPSKERLGRGAITELSHSSP